MPAVMHSCSSRTENYPHSRVHEGYGKRELPTFLARIPWKVWRMFNGRVWRDKENDSRETKTRNTIQRGIRGNETDAERDERGTTHTFDTKNGW